MNSVTRVYVYLYRDGSNKRYYSGQPLSESEMLRRDLAYEGWHMSNECPVSDSQ